MELILVYQIHHETKTNAGTGLHILKWAIGKGGNGKWKQSNFDVHVYKLG